MKKWRLLDTGCRRAAENMALDDVILECRARDLIPNTLRFLQFDPPAALVGYHQDVDQEIRMDYVNSNDIEVNRRLTGGGTIYFDKPSLGWEVIASKSSVPSSRPDELFGLMCEGVVTALNLLGVQATFRPRNDIEVEGKKISGTGGTERSGAFLFQGTLLIDFDVERMIRALRIPIMKLKDKELESAKDRVTWLKRELGFQPGYKEIKAALKRGFEQVLGVDLEDGGLTMVEENLFKDKLPSFQSEEWIYLNRSPLEEAAVVHAVDKTPGGLIRVSLAIDKRANVIKSMLITGDFFVFPPRAIPDLEATLKFTPCHQERIKGAVEKFFSESQVDIPGISPGVIAGLIMEAVDRASYEPFGISLSEANHLYPVAKSMRDLIYNDYDHLLLPYCAKPPSCDYRGREGCIRCGECCISEAYDLAEAAGLKPLTIQSFEHLMDTLTTMSRNGAKGYIGCCCEAFYCKHRDELEEAGIPGIIIDIDDTTCYDLGKEKDAYEGNFEAQTRLKVELLTKFLNNIHNHQG